MKQTYGSLTLEVPADFEDETVIVLRASPPPPAARMRVPKGDPIRPTYVVKRTPLRADPAVSLEALAKAEEDLLRLTLGAEIQSREIRSLGGADSICLELTFAGPEGPVRQAHVSQVKGRWYLAFVATAPDDLSFEDVRAQLMELVATAAIV
jgi:hypothetical protein